MRKLTLNSIIILTLTTFLAAMASPVKVKITDIKSKSKDPADQYIEGELTKDSKFFIDRDYLIVAVPEGFEGMQTIMAANDDKKQAGTDFLSFTVDKDVDVYVALDSRADEEKGGTPPTWLVEGFEKQVKDGEPVAVETTDGGMVTVNLWKSSFKAGTITLGGNAEGSAGAGSNYFVILTGQSTGASVDAKSKLSTTWANIKSH